MGGGDWFLDFFDFHENHYTYISRHSRLIATGSKSLDPVVTELRYLKHGTIYIKNDQKIQNFKNFYFWGPNALGVENY